MAEENVGPRKDIKPRNRLPQAKQSRPPSKPPRGTKKNPWFRIPEHKDKITGLIQPVCFVFFNKDGVWKVPQLPPSYPVQTETSY